MRNAVIFFILFALLAGAAPALADSADPLFISLTSDEANRSLMAVSFGQAQIQRGHALTMYLNDRGVLVASKKNSDLFAEQQKGLSEIVAKGGTVLVCPNCSKRFGVAESDLLSGAKISNPDMTGEALFKANGKALSW